jgi:DNA modification methylase
VPEQEKAAEAKHRGKLANDNGPIGEWKMTYQDFLKSKIILASESGFAIDPSEVNPIAKPHQRDAIVWAIRGGRRALFESFGLGKSLQELEWCRLIIKHKGGKALIVLPLGVKQEFTRDAVVLLGMEQPEYVRNMIEVRAAKTDIMITNYERVRDGDIDPTYFMATSLDEASCLRSYGSKTYQTFLNKFQGVPYKLVSTATPSPNRYKELIHYAGYLEIMDTGQALTRFFQRDSTKANNLTLYPHKETEFWLWLSSWALFITKPSDLGYDDTGYALPPLQINYHMVQVDQSTAGADRDGQMRLIRDAALSLADAAKEKRDSIDYRIAKMTEIVNTNPNDHFILWHDLESERHAIKKALPEAVEIYGSQDCDTREQRVIDFSEGRSKLLATKKELSGQGCNFQKHCHRAIFLGIDYELNDFIQAIHRIYRFLQTQQVIIDIIYTESEQQILKVLLDKWQQHDYMTNKMTEIIKKHGLSSTSMLDKMARSIGVKRVKIESKNYTIVNNDCVIETASMPDNSIDLIVTSIPFGNHYEYTPSYNDFGHNPDTAAFFEQMDYLTPNLLRILRPGRVYACHVKDRVLFGNATGTGMPTMEPFHAECISHYRRHGFQYFGMITVVTDVVRENNQTYRLGWSEQCKDGSKMGVGCPEYILLFRKLPTDTSKAYADIPVAKTKQDYTRAQWQIDAHGYWRSSGNRLLTKDELARIEVPNLQAVYRKFSRDSVYSYEDHIALAKELDRNKKLPASFMVVAPGSWTDEVWDDINRMRTLNTTQSQKRQQMHVCPLQLDIVERLINRYSNPGETAFDPFGGLMTVPLVAIQSGRKGYGIELNTDYFRDGLGYLKTAEEKLSTPTLFDFVDGL